MGQKSPLCKNACVSKSEISSQSIKLNEIIVPDETLVKKNSVLKFVTNPSLSKGKIKKEELQTYRTSNNNLNIEKNNPIINSLKPKSIEIQKKMPISISFREEIKEGKLVEENNYKCNNNKNFYKMKSVTISDYSHDEEFCFEFHFEFLGKLYKDLPGNFCKAKEINGDKIYEIQTISRDLIIDHSEFVSEIKRFSQINHNNIVNIKNIFFDKKNYFILRE